MDDLSSLDVMGNLIAWLAVTAIVLAPLAWFMRHRVRSRWSHPLIVGAVTFAVSWVIRRVHFTISHCAYYDDSFPIDTSRVRAVWADCPATWIPEFTPLILAVSLALVAVWARRRRVS